MRGEKVEGHALRLYNNDKFAVVRSESASCLQVGCVKYVHFGVVGFWCGGMCQSKTLPSWCPDSDCACYFGHDAWVMPMGRFQRRVPSYSWDHPRLKAAQVESNRSNAGSR